jgi:hypothetical protein
MTTTLSKQPATKQFSTGNWEYILKYIANEIKKTHAENTNAFQLEFNKRVEARYNDIATVHQPLALKIARKFKFMTAYEKANQYLSVPPHIRKR